VQQGGGSNGLAIAALVLGIIGLLLSWLIVPAILSILAIIFGFLGRSKAKNQPHVGGTGMAIAGLVTGIIGVLIAIAVFVFGSILVNEVSDNANEDIEQFNEELEELEELEEPTTP